MKIYEVGGCVRDRLIGEEPKDIDFAVEAESFEAMKKYLIDNKFTIFQETPQFFTVRAKRNGTKMVGDFVLCRKESGSLNARHPEKVGIGTIYDDLARRDFTVNAIAQIVYEEKSGFTRNSEIIDPYNGREDLKNRVLRTVGNPTDRFSEDSLRILRALRFSITKGFAIDHSVWDAIKDFDPKLLASVSIERKREELYKMFAKDSLKSMDLIMKLPQELREAIFAGNVLWLKPTLEKVNN